ncbi:hypothetical protein BU23DRAFT_604028 [Bimuria novae-zelandiae CBS 107.79]|uniref:Extracellular serine-rich protein n=1 Tax=Bimuria novae-zelandiae CBS 107.79 TaxID=1447943 RepID=A0A6A5UKE4_9PLEO|nr:hypothetical protein BU23DRAFT_604028 [Bimuria novae-zelandiae CBS 107.79]
MICSIIFAFAVHLAAHLVHAAEFNVTVGIPLHKFGRPLIQQAAVGDTVVFQFYPPQHSVVRADEGNPCIPYEYYHSGSGGFFSGMQTVGVNDPIPTWTLRINDTEPIFFYCSAEGSCVEQQMVGGINMTHKNQSTLDRQIKLINKGTRMLQPGEAIPPEGTDIPTPQPHAHTALPPGAIVGIAVGGAAVLALAAALFFFVGRAKTLNEFLRRRDGNAHGGSTGQKMVQSTGFEGCVPIKGDQPAPPGYPPAYSSPVMGGAMHPAYRHGSDGGYMRDSATSPGVEAWRWSMYDGPPQEMDAQGIASR